MYENYYTAKQMLEIAQATSPFQIRPDRGEFGPLES